MGCIGGHPIPEEGGIDGVLSKLREGDHILFEIQQLVW